MVSVAVRARHLHVIGRGFDPRREPACLRGQRPNPQNYWWSYPKGFPDGCPEVSSSVLRLQKCIMASLSVLFLRFYSQNILIVVFVRRIVALLVLFCSSLGLYTLLDFLVLCLCLFRLSL